MKQKYTLLFLLALLNPQLIFSQSYFPPKDPALAWDTLAPSSLGWCPERIDSLYNYLQTENTKGFLLLKDGKIVLEKYFGTFTKDSTWYWASAGKTITSLLIGQAQEAGLLNIHDKTNGYLGNGWTNCTQAQEDSITILNQLTMTSGLDDGVADNHCTLDTCLNFLTAPNTRWAYHNAPYTLLDPVIEAASGSTLNNFTNVKLKSATGMTGLWLTVGFNTIFFSNVRSMARFGLLVSRNCIWDGDTLLHDSAYKSAMVNTSQNLNKSYGYLWWLNGKTSYMLPTTQFVFPGSLAPDAPSDMFAGIGKNGQLVSIAPSQGLVMIRMGENPSSPGSEVSNVLCNNIWKYINEFACVPLQSETLHNGSNELIISPNPGSGTLQISHLGSGPFEVKIFTLPGVPVKVIKDQRLLDISDLYPGTYYIKISQDDQHTVRKFTKF